MTPTPLAVQDPTTGQWSCPGGEDLVIRDHVRYFPETRRWLSQASVYPLLIKDPIISQSWHDTCTEAVAEIPKHVAAVRDRLALVPFPALPPPPQ